MSDGNFNRSLLPHTPYQSGLKCGKAMARQRAIDALRAMLPDINPRLTAEERQAIVEAFRTRLSTSL